MTPFELVIGGRRYRAHPARAASLAIPIAFFGGGVSAFGVEPAAANAVSGPGFVGDTRRGGSCNVGELRLVPHCHGTHTECVGHLVDEPVSVDAVMREPLVPATLVTIDPESAAGHPEADATIAAASDRLVAAAALAKTRVRVDFSQQAHAENEKSTLTRVLDPFLRAVVIRTLPNGRDKLAARYTGDHPPAYLSAAAGKLLAELGCEHVVVDVPSLDRMADGGKLAAHRAFFGLPAGSRSLRDATRAQCTITELAFVADEVADGHYLLGLQIAPFAADAAPSRPMLIPLEALE